MSLREALTAIMALCFHLGTGSLLFGIAMPSVRLLLAGVLFWGASWCIAQVRM